MTRKHMVVAALATVGLAAGTAGAVAATKGDEARQRETAVLGAAAERLDVSPEKLRAALAAAQDAQLDADVKAGRLTQAQADAIKTRRKADGLVLGGPGGRHGGRGHGGPGGRFGGGRLALRPATIAKALGLTPAQLRERFENGDTIAEIAKAQSKSLDDVRAAVRTAAKDQLDADVKAGRLTAAQRTEALEHLEEHLARIGEFSGRRGGPGGRHGGPDGPPPMPGG